MKENDFIILALHLKISLFENLKFDSELFKNCVVKFLFIYCDRCVKMQVEWFIYSHL